MLTVSSMQCTKRVSNRPFSLKITFIVYSSLLWFAKHSRKTLWQCENDISNSAAKVTVLLKVYSVEKKNQVANANK